MTMITQTRFLIDVPERLRNKLDDYVRRELEETMPYVIRWFLDREPTYMSSLMEEYHSVLKDAVETIDNYETYFTGEYDLENIHCVVKGDVIMLELTYVTDHSNPTSPIPDLGVL